jgi:hypothetical protein
MLMFLMGYKSCKEPNRYKTELQAKQSHSVRKLQKIWISSRNVFCMIKPKLQVIHPKTIHSPNNTNTEAA